MTDAEKYKLVTEIGPTGYTHTPVEVVLMTRRLSASIAQRLGGSDIVAQVIPDTLTNAIQILFSSTIRSLRLFVFVDKPYSMDGFDPSTPTDAYQIVIDKTWVTLPDVPEALHFVGILIHDLGARISSIGLREREWNRDVCTQPMVDAGVPGKLDRCVLPRARSGKQYTGNDRFFVSKDGTHTPLEVFDWICEQVAGMDISGKVKVNVCGIRLRGLSGGNGKASDAVATGSEEAVADKVCLVMVGQDGKRRWVNFQLGSELKFDYRDATVTDYMHALHIIGALIDTFQGVEIQLGHRHREKNPEVMARPISWVVTHGELVRASNVVPTQVARL